MKLRLTLLFVVLSVCVQNLSAGSFSEPFDSLLLVERCEVEKTLTLLKNENSILPLRYMDTLNIVSLYFGKNGSGFHSMVNSYKESFNLSEKTFNDIQAISPNLIIVGIDSTAVSTDQLRVYLEDKKLVVGYTDGNVP